MSELAPAARLSHRLFLGGAAAWILIGLGHTFGAQLLPALNDPPLPEAAVYAAMARVRPMSGSEHTLYDFYQGNGWMLGVLCLALGGLSLALGLALSRRGVSLPRVLPILNAVTSVVALGLAVLYFPMPPIVFLLVATGCFVGSSVVGRG